MIRGWFIRQSVPFAKVGAASLFSLIGVVFFSLLALLFGSSFSAATLLWFAVFLFPFGFALGSRLLARRTGGSGDFAMHLLVGYAGYIAFMASVFVLGLYSRADVWSMIAILVLAALLLYAPRIRSWISGMLRSNQRGPSSNIAESAQHGLFSEDRGVIHLGKVPEKREETNK